MTIIAPSGGQRVAAVSASDADLAHALLAEFEAHRCALRVLYARRRLHAIDLHAGGHGLSLDRIGSLYRLTRERVRQIISQPAPRTGLAFSVESSRRGRHVGPGLSTEAQAGAQTATPHTTTALEA